MYKYVGQAGSNNNNSNKDRQTDRQAGSPIHKIKPIYRANTPTHTRAFEEIFH